MLLQSTGQNVIFRGLCTLGFRVNLWVMQLRKLFSAIIILSLIHIYLKWYKRSLSHNTVTVDAKDQKRSTGKITKFIPRSDGGYMGVDVENLWISQPDSGEQALEIADQLIRSSAVDIVVIDSVAALTPKRCV